MTRLVVERLNAGDAAGDAALYEPQAVLAYPPIGDAGVLQQFVHATQQVRHTSGGTSKPRYPISTEPPCR
jgi:hypothetical protein